MTAMPYYTFKVNQFGPPSYEWVLGVQQMYLGSLFILLAAVFDMLDGVAARLLGVFSPIGKDLDSLADVVSFGVAPSMILFQLLWDAAMGEKNVFDTSMLTMAPAFLLPCFSALRLAKFNITHDRQKNHFIGMPTPAAGIIVAALPVILWYDNYGMAPIIKNKWVIYCLIFVLCYLMVSSIRFFKLVPSKFNLRYAWPQIVLVFLTILSIALFHFAGLFLAFAGYILLSLIYKEPKIVA